MTKMHVGIDIDNTITRAPNLFALLAQAVRAQGGTIHIVSSRTDSGATRIATAKELAEYGVAYDRLFLFPEKENTAPCPHRDLDWYQQSIWGKVAYCLKHKVGIFFDDEQKVVDLFHRFAPAIIVLRVTNQ